MNMYQRSRNWAFSFGDENGYKKLQRKPCSLEGDGVNSLNGRVRPNGQQRCVLWRGYLWQGVWIVNYFDPVPFSWTVDVLIYRYLVNANWFSCLRSHLIMTIVMVHRMECFLKTLQKTWCFMWRFIFTFCPVVEGDNDRPDRDRIFKIRMGMNGVWRTNWIHQID